MMPVDLSDEMLDLLRRYKEKFGEEYPYMYVGEQFAKEDLPERLKDGGEPIPFELWRRDYEIEMANLAFFRDKKNVNKKPVNR